jgi:formylmethanofuran dehydrogenase subunit B
MEAHMRHFTRYSTLAKGLFTPQGRQGKKIVVVDVRPTPTARAADYFLQIKPGNDFEVFNALRALIKGLRLENVDPGTGTIAGVPLSTWQELAQLMRSCRYGVVFFGIGITMSRGKEMNIELLLTLIQELNQYTRFYAIPMRGHGNVTGINHVLTWQTGYPFAVNFSRGYPRYNPGEFSVVDMLGRQEVDAALIIATDPGAHLPWAAVRHLQKIPTIVLEPHCNLTTPWAQVVIPVAPAGVGAAGTFYRMDNVPLRVKKLVDLPYPSDEEVLRALKERIANA